MKERAAALQWGGGQICGAHFQVEKLQAETKAWMSSTFLLLHKLEQSDPSNCDMSNLQCFRIIYRLIWYRRQLTVDIVI